MIGSVTDDDHNLNINVKERTENTGTLNAVFSNFKRVIYSLCQRIQKDPELHS